MATATSEKGFRPETVLSPEDSDDLAGVVQFIHKNAVQAELIGPDGERTGLPAQVYEVLVKAVEMMKQHRAVTIVPVDHRLTTQQAADFLGISRPTLIKLIDAGQLACERPSRSRHRRLRLADVVAYQQRQAMVQEEAMQALVSDAEAHGLYDVDPDEFRKAVAEVRAEGN